MIYPMDRQRRASDAYRRGAARGEDSGKEGVPPQEGAGEDPVRGATFEKTVKERPPAERTPEGQSGSQAQSPAEESSDSPAPDTPPGNSLPSQANRVESLLAGPGGVNRAARLLIAMGAERAADVVAHLGEREVEKVMQAIIELGEVKRSELLAQTEVEPPRVAAGPAVARAMLIAAFGEEEGERRFFRSVPSAPEQHFSFINDLNPAQLEALLKDESSAVVALVVTHLEPPAAATALRSLRPDAQAEVARRIGRMGKLSRSTVVAVEQGLKEKVRKIGNVHQEESGGSSTLAAILRHMAPSHGEAILGELSSVDPDLTRTIQDQLYTVEMLKTLRPRDLAELIRPFSERDLAVFLKGKDEELRALVLRAVSERRAADISDEYAHLGPRSRQDVDDATRAVLDRLKALEEDGAILVPKEGDRYI
jgi:flagellar motor switch protein FliG